MATFTGSLSREVLGFRHEHLAILFQVLQWPEELVCHAGGLNRTKDYKDSGEQAFLFMLYRHHMPDNLTNCEGIFGWSYCKASVVFQAAESWMISNHGHRLSNLGFWRPRFKAYNQALRQHLSDKGDLIPVEFANSAFFLGGPWEYQAFFWNAKAKYHNLAFQALVGMDGMAVDFWGETVGRHHDEWILEASDLNNRLAQVQVGQDVQYYAFTDKGYANQSHVKAAHHGFPRPTFAQDLANFIMGTCRVTVEQFFQKWKRRSALIRLPKTMQLGNQPVHNHAVVACLLANAHSCLEGNQTSLLMKINPPSIYEYFM